MTQIDIKSIFIRLYLNTYILETVKMLKYMQSQKWQKR